VEEHKELILPLAVALSNHYMDAINGEKIVNDNFPSGAVKISTSILEGEYFKVKSNYANAEEGTYMFLKQKETPASAKAAKGKGVKTASTPKQNEKEAKDIEELKAHIVANEFEWMKDGKKKNGELEFKADGTMTAADSTKEVSDADAI